MCAPLIIVGQNRIGTGAAVELYQQHCMVCHGENLNNGLGGNLIDQEWKYANSDAEIAQVIQNGLPDDGMMGFGNLLTDKEIRSLVIYIREEAQLSRRAGAEAALKPTGGIYKTEHHPFSLEELTQIEGIPWAIVFLPDGSMYVTERGGELYHIKDGETKPIKGLPAVRAKGQGGMLEVALHPQYADNGWVYLAYAHELGENLAMTRVVRGKIENHRWGGEEVIYNAPEDTYVTGNGHFGTRLVLKDGYLFFSIGDRQKQAMAQDLSKPNGKIHRLHDDGRVPRDNPFVGRKDALPTIWTYGHRNPQGLDLDPRNGDLWSTEHGPRGGDETNHIRRGRNYGWPVITYGMNYNGTPITALTEKEGMEQPAHYWTPSIAVAGIDFYEGERFPEWTYNLFVTGLASQELHRLVIEDQRVVADEIVLQNEGRMRDVVSGPDGLLYVLLESNGKGRVCRLVQTD